MSDAIKSSYLYRSPSFFKGAARVVSVGGKLDEYRTSKSESESESESDAQALSQDWKMVGKDLQQAIER